jgi:all-trans-8'-apo-beta-carotenal 15,15'-oxygenase
LNFSWTDSIANYRAGAGKKGLWRYTVDTKSQKVSKERLVANDVSFATINPTLSCQRHRYVYYTAGALADASSPPQGIGRYDAETGTTTSWFPEEFQYCGEPMYAPRVDEDGKMAAEDDGYILSVLFDGRSEQSELLIFSANQLDKGPITRIPLGFAIPHGLFGVFTADPDAAWSEDVINRRAKLADKIESRGSMWNEVKSDFAGLG